MKETWADRLIQEYDQLLGRLDLLGEFRQTPAFSNLPWEDQVLLHRQFNAMQLYAAVLKDRVARIPDSVKTAD